MADPIDKPLVIYHGECFDGFTAAWAVRRHFMFQHGIEPDFFAALYPAAGEPTELPDVEGRVVIMVDFCVSREQLLALREGAKSLLVLDHHKTHEEACSGLPFCEFDMDRSGASMAWDRFQLSGRPWLVQYVEDRDLWRFRLADSKTVNAFIMCQELTWQNWDRMADDLTVEQAEQLGRGAEMYLQRYVRDMKKVARRMPFPKAPDAEGEQIDPPNLGALPGAGYYDDIPVVNAPYLGTSELVGALAEEALFAVGWFQRSDGLYQYSLRSRGDFDVSALAKAFGGGGHAKAAGITVPGRIH